MEEYKQAIPAAQVVGDTRITSIAITSKKKQKPETLAGSGATSTPKGSKQRKARKSKHVAMVMVLNPIESQIPLHHSRTTATDGEERGTPADSVAISTPKVNKSKRRKPIKPWDHMVLKVVRVQRQSLNDAPVASATVGEIYRRDLSAPLFTCHVLN
jgi:hypothetical protein